ncbi:MAG: phosphoribosylformylglycinamidine cyclo-ligase [Actinomycetota bacterium]
MREDRTTTYAGAGVDVGAAGRAVELIRGLARSTYRPEVLGDIGGFGGLFAPDLTGYRQPVLVSSTDGVGTKVMIAQRMGAHDTIGIDLVAMSVDDVAACGAEPLFFLDYIVAEKVVPEVIDQIVSGIAEGCRKAGCSLIGGEIAEHPGHLPPGSYDLAGFCVGVVERARLVTGEGIQEGDSIVGLASSGLHANGYSMARKVLLEGALLDLEERPAGLECSLGEELLRPTAIYAPALAALRREVEVRGLAHVTGGGIAGNVGRIIPNGLAGSIDRTSWPVPPIFGLIASLGNVAEEEMFATFNMGIGMVAVVAEADGDRAVRALEACNHAAHQIGLVEPAP